MRAKKIKETTKRKALRESARKHVVSNQSNPKGRPPTFTSGNGKTVNTNPTKNQSNNNDNKK